MDLKQSKIFSFHFLLIPVFFVWHIMNEYFALISFGYGGRYLLYYLGVSVVIFLIGKLILKDTAKAACWSAILLIIFFFWGAFHDFSKTLRLPSFFVSYKFLLSLVFILIVLLTIYLRKKRKSLLKANKFFALLFSFLLLLEAVQSGYKFLSKQNQKNNFAYSNPIEPIASKMTDSLKPDIFFIVFDEYASSVSLQEYLGYNNTPLDTLLKENDLFIARDSKSNYNSTPYSIASTFNLDYFNKPLEGKRTIPKELLKARYTLKKSLVPRWLVSQGYTIKNYGLADLEGSPVSVPQLFENDITAALYNETFWARLESEIGWHLRIPFLTERTNKRTQRSYDSNVRITMTHLDALLAELQMQSAAPKFVFAHVQLPHDPYYLNSKGERRAISPSDELPSIRDSLYLDQLKYANHWIGLLANAANKSFHRPRVIIIEGDHGRRSDPAKDSYIRRKQFMNLNSYYFSDKDYSMLYDSISPVNSFRLVFNKYFRTNFPLLKDSTILLY